MSFWEKNTNNNYFLNSCLIYVSYVSNEKMLQTLELQNIIFIEVMFINACAKLH